MIYIDPPYNTGNDSFVYPDDYTETLKEYLARTGRTDEAGFVNKQTLWRKNTKENGQFHSVWLSMMYPRLFLARNLLREDGVIFISIDDNEVAGLKMLLDEIFGEENFEGHIHWRRRHNQPNDKTKMIGLVAEHILCYARNSAQYKKMGVGKVDLTGDFSNPDNDSRGAWATKPWKVGSDQSGSKYEIINPKSGKVFNEEWMGDETTYKGLLADNRIVFPNGGNGLPRKKYFRIEREEEGQCATNWWSHEEFGHNQGANDLLSQFFGEKNIFSNPKPTSLVRGLLQIANANENSLILDLFSGSGTTAQAVLDLNEEDGGNRQFICVQMPEALEEGGEAFKAGYRTIADIGRARIAKVIEKIESKRLEGSALGVLTQDDMQRQALGFNAFKLAPSNFKEWRTDVDNEADLLAQLEYHVDSAKPDSEAGSMVYELLLKLALPITTPIESHKVGDATTAATVFMAKPDSGKRVAMFFEAPANHAGDVLAFILKAKPVKVLCLNKCFVDSQALTNFSLQLQDADIALEVL